jgi:Ca2+-binding RTX toxin-like protein
LGLGFYTQTAGTTHLGGGEIGADQLDILAGSLTGAGVVLAPVLAAGLVSPGFSSGIIRIHDDYSHDAGGELVVELGGLTPGLGSGHHDQLDVQETVSLAGALTVSLIGGFSSTLGDQFMIIQNHGTDPVIGTFDGMPEGTRFTSHGRQFEISYRGLDGNDNDVVLTDVNAPPTADAGGPYTVVRGGTIRLDASGSSDPDQPANTLTYIWDLDDDGAFGETGNDAARGDELGINPTFSAAGLDLTGTHTVHLRVIDGGGLDAEDDAVVTVLIAAILPDPLGGEALYIGGTSANDSIVVSTVGNQGSVTVTINGSSLGSFDFVTSPFGRIVVHAQAGNDDVKVAGSIAHSAWLHGDAGDDRLKGGAGHDVLLGGAGADLLVGDGGRDLLIGGTGADRMVGNADDDILIAGFTAFDALDMVLCAIMDEWTSSRSYADRVKNLQGDETGREAAFADRANGEYYLAVDGSNGRITTVHDDGEADVLTGSAGQDWFFANLVIDEDDDATRKDKITDLSAAEFADDLDFINS